MSDEQTDSEARTTELIYAEFVAALVQRYRQTEEENRKEYPHIKKGVALRELPELVLKAYAHYEDAGQTAEQALSALAVIAEEIMRKSDKENAE